MAYEADILSEDERQKLLGGVGSSAPGYGIPTPVGGPPPINAPGPTSGFQNLSAYFNANKDQAAAQGEQIASTLETSANEAAHGDDPGKADQVLGQVNAADTPGGLATVLPQQHPEDTNYTSGMAGLDAYLGTRGTAPERFSKIKEMFGSKLQGVEAAPESPGEMPLPPSYVGGGDWRNNMGSYEASVNDYLAKLEEYKQKRATYEAWAKRKAERLGEAYAPSTEEPPDYKPSSLAQRVFGG